jgi:hypothetical protein
MMKKVLLLVPIVFLICFVIIVYADLPIITTNDNCRFTIGAGGSIGVYHDVPNINIRLTVITGTFLGNGTVYGESYAGSIVYNPEDNCSIHLSSSNNETEFSVNDSTNVTMLTANILNGTVYTIHWKIPYNVWLPIHLALGGIGITFLCIIPVLAIRKFKQKDYVWTLVYGSIGILVGIALIIAWLWI